jgi:histidinol-phosphate phosphatase family protein
MGENRDRVDTPECHARIRAEHVSHLRERQSTGDSRTAVFLDRDGTLNVEVNRLRSVDQLELIPGAADAVRSLNRAGFLAVVVTNQAAIARGDCSEADLEQIHDKLESLLGEHGAYLDAIYYCPHHPDRGSPGERAELKRFSHSHGRIMDDRGHDSRTPECAKCADSIHSSAHGIRRSRSALERTARLRILRPQRSGGIRDGNDRPIVTLLDVHPFSKTFAMPMPAVAAYIPAGNEA